MAWSSVAILRDCIIVVPHVLDFDVNGGEAFKGFCALIWISSQRAANFHQEKVGD